MEKTYIPEGQEACAPPSQIGATLEALAGTIAARRGAGEESYTHRLLEGKLDKLLKKVSEESLEVCLAAKELEMMQKAAPGVEVAAAGAAAGEGVSAAGAAGEGGEGAAAGAAAGEGGEGAAAGAGETSPTCETADASAVAEYDAGVNHMRYEAADVVYHLMVLLERFGISIDEFAAELNTRMTDAERPAGVVKLKDGYVNRGR